ncbi:hypothetical protein LIA77_03668 [Sarocladium implicatum]|nr:hypothetical protein LIA77_03668 [Sarocladium implicatum]
MDFKSWGNLRREGAAPCVQWHNSTPVPSKTPIPAPRYLYSDHRPTFDGPQMSDGQDQTNGKGYDDKSEAHWVEVVISCPRYQRETCPPCSNPEPPGTLKARHGLDVI